MMEYFETLKELVHSMLNNVVFNDKRQVRGAKVKLWEIQKTVTIIILMDQLILMDRHKLQVAI